MSEKPKKTAENIKTVLHTRASKNLSEEVRAELLIEDTEKSAARLKELLSNDCE